ncbi:MAG: pimeloyl-ACP methyl ester esterase BioH [Chromatiaceae bacterium]|jgi:pimeloyl-[acyl-carrier protein] methyl ester esterase
MTLYHRQLGEGPDLLLVHGWGMNAAVWGPLPSELAQRFRVTVLELPGHGASEAAEVADLADWAARCLEVAPPRAHWLGWSLGGQVALRAALDAPERVAGLTLIATTPRFVQGADWSYAMPIEAFRQFADALAKDPNGALLRFLGLQVQGAEHARETLRLLRRELAQRPTASDTGLQQGLALLMHSDLRAGLAGLRCPSQWLFGSRDALVPAALGDWLGQHLAGSRIEVIAGAGHAPFLSHPGVVMDALVPVVAA